MDDTAKVKSTNQLLKDQVQVTPPSLGNYLLKDTAGAARNTAALGLSVKDSSVSTTAAARLAAARERIVYFDLNSSSVRPEAIPIIEAHARLLIKDTKLRVALEGHSNESLGREFSVALAQRRAESVREILSLLGVSEYQMEVVSFGKEKPAVPGDTEAAMQENRRVEINYR